MEEKKLKKKNLGGVIAFIVASGVTTFIINQNKNDHFSDIKELSEKMNKTCPLKIDNDTRIDSTAAKDNPVAITYYYTVVTANKDSLTVNLDDVKKMLAQKAQANLDTTPAMATFREAKVTLNYNYRDKNGKQLFNYSVVPKK